MIEVKGGDWSGWAEAGAPVLWAHDYRGLPVASGSVPSVVESTKLRSVADFGEAGIYPFGDMVYELARPRDGKPGRLRAASIGFNPKEWTFDEDRDGYTFLTFEGLEWSICPVPMNAEAVQEAAILRSYADSLGVDLAPLREFAEKILDSGASSPEEKAAAEAARKAVAPVMVPVAAPAADPKATRRATVQKMDMSGSGYGCPCCQAGACACCPDDNWRACACCATGTCPCCVGEMPCASASTCAAPVPHAAAMRTADLILAVTKAGRVLSAANEDRIRSARDHGDGLCAALDEVLSQIAAEEAADEGKAAGPPVALTLAPPAPPAFVLAPPELIHLPPGVDVRALATAAVKAVTDEARYHLTGRLPA